MIASTLLAVLFVPVFFIVFQSLSEWWGHGRPAVTDAPQPEGVPSGTY
jgi:hypothetical protein